MAAGNCAAGVSHWHTAPRHGLPQQRGQNSTTATTAAATVRKWHRRCVHPSPQGMIPCNPRRHADAICILAKAHPKVNTLWECAANTLSGNMILQSHQKQRSSRHADALRALQRWTVNQQGKKAMLMDRGFAGLLAGAVAPLLFKALPSIVGGVGSLVRQLKGSWCK